MEDSAEGFLIPKEFRIALWGGLLPVRIGGACKTKRLQKKKDAYIQRNYHKLTEREHRRM